MANFDINVFYNVLRSIYDDYSAKEQSVKFDVDLSDSGRQKKLDKINSDRQKAVSQLQTTFNTEYDKQMSTFDSKLNKKESAKDKAKAYMDTQLVKDFNLSTYHDGSPILDDNSRTALLLSELQGLRKDLTESIQLQSLSQRSESWYRQQLSKGMTDKDLERLETLSKSLELKSDGEIADKLKTEFDAVINKLRLDALTDGQRQALADKQTLENDRELLNYSFENMLKRGEYQDVRQVGKELPVNDIRPYSAPTKSNASPQGE